MKRSGKEGALGSNTAPLQGLSKRAGKHVDEGIQRVGRLSLPDTPEGPSDIYVWQTSSLEMSVAGAHAITSNAIPLHTSLLAHLQRAPMPSRRARIECAVRHISMGMRLFEHPPRRV